MVGWEAFTHTIEATAGELLSVSEFSHSYRVRVLEIDKKEITPIDVSLILPPNLSVQEGDEVTAVGKFSFPRDTPDYAQEKQLWNRGIVASFRAFHTDKKIPDTYSPFVRLRLWFSDRLSQLFPQVGHDILSGILLGQKNTLSPELKNMLKASGLMHIMVVSGGNVIMLIIFLSLFIRALHPWIRIGIVLMTTLSFVFLVGGDAPVWRAAMMGVIGYSASLW
jgi:hypothetical protein